MKNKTVTKRVGAMLLSALLISVFSLNAIAAESEAPETEVDYLIVNGTEVIAVGEDYENPESGEYIHWDNRVRGTDKSFSFKIRYSITSSSFTVNSTRERISCSAIVTDGALNGQSGYSGHAYTVTMGGKTLNFKVNGTQSGTISGLSKGSKYTIKITNKDYLPSNRYLNGSGKVVTA